MPKKKCEFCNKLTEVKEVSLPYITNSSKKYIYNYFSCCDYLKQKTFFGKNELKKLYSSDYIVFSNNHIKSLISNIFVKFRLWKYKSLIQGKSVLELGSGMGDFLIGAKSLNPKSIIGVEGSKYACKYIQEKYGINVINTDIESFFVEKKFDSIFMFHVIEHMKNPIAVINNCLKHLKPGGVLVIETPNLSSWDSLLFKKKWYNLSAPYHTYIFSQKTFQILMSGKRGQKLCFSFSLFPNALSKQFKEFPKFLFPFIFIVYIPFIFFSGLLHSGSIILLQIKKSKK